MGKRNRRKGAANAQPSQELDSHKSEKYTSKAIKNWNDVEHDDIDKFHDTRNKISFNDNDNDSDDIEDEEILGVEYPQDEDEEDEEEEEEDTMEDWGTKKSNYYDGDEVEDEEDARLEEEEAIRIQKMRVNAMNEQDFMAPTYGQLTGKDLIKDELEDHKLILDLDKELKNIDLTQPTKSIKKGDGYTKNEAIEILEKDSPELFGLLEQLKEKWEMVKDESSEVATKIKELSPEAVKATPLLQHFYLKYETTLNYLTNISFYLYLKSVGTPNLQDHPIIDVLIKHANIIKNLEDAEEGSDDLLEMVKEAIVIIENGGVVGDEELGENSNEDLSLEEEDEEEEKEEESQDEEPLEDKEEAMESEPESSDVEALPEQTLAELRRSLKTSGSKRMAKESDFQDTEYLDEADAAEKMIKKKSLRHYASVINQKRAKLPKFTGDIDIPYKPKDEKYKQPVNQAINNQSNDADIFDDDENEVAPSIEETKKERKNTKKVKVLNPEEMERRTEAWKAMNPDEQEVEGSSKRIASYKILKNKGLTPKRKKEQRNPRVKHRKKFEKASKKLSSFKRVVQDSKTSYGGEATGIKTHLSRSVRFQ